MQGNPKIAAADLSVGQEHEAVVVENLSRTQIVQYAGASGDFNPIHHDETFATKAGYPSVFSHGMLTMGLTGKMLTDWVGDGVINDIGVRFVRQVWPGDTLTAKGTVRSIDERGDESQIEIDLETTNQKGQPVVSGSATVVLPARV